MASTKEQVLLVGGSIWKSGDIFLSAMTKGVPNHVPLDSISEADRPAVDKAVEEGVLTICKSVPMTIAHAKTRLAKEGQDPLVTTEFTGRLEWKDQKDVIDKDLKRAPKNPSLATRSAVYSDRKSKAFKILQASAKTLMKTLVGEVGQYSEADDKATFLRELEYIESQGYNPTGEARTSVAHLIGTLLEPFNAGGLSVSPVVSFAE